MLWRALLCESCLLLGTGCSDRRGRLASTASCCISHALATVTGFPIVFSVGALVALVSFVLVSVVSVAIVALLGYRAADVPPYV